MSPEQMTEALHEKAEATRVGPAPVDQMRRNVAKRQRGRTIALAAASVALVLGGGAVVQQVLTSDGGPDRNNTTIPQAPVPPDGMKFVGMGNVVIAVPEAWGTYNTLCSSPRSDGVFFGVGQVDCLYGGSAGSPVLMLALDSDEGRQASRELLRDRAREDATNTGEPKIIGEPNANGVDVMRGPVCGELDLCDLAYPETLIVPSEGVVLVSLLGGSQGSAVLDTVQLLPEGFTTVPSFEPRPMRSEVETVLLDAGLDPYSAAPDFDAPVLGTDPSAGSVVRLGDTVTLELSDPTGPGSADDGAVDPSEILGTWRIKSMARVTEGRALDPSGDYLQPQALTLTFTRTAWTLRNDGCGLITGSYTLVGRDITSVRGGPVRGHLCRTTDSTHGAYPSAADVIEASTHMTAATMGPGWTQLYFHEDNWRIVMALER